ncbi:D-alanine--D-alanine ligase [Planctomycetota bacterium]
MAVESSTSSQSSKSRCKLKVAVLAGGIGAERQVSLQSGKCIRQALDEAGFDATIADISPDNLTVLDEEEIDIFFLALHGTFGEDGRLQEILEQRNLAYTGSGPEASRLAFDKMASKKSFSAVGVLVPEATAIYCKEDMENFETRFNRSGDKYVVKPTRQGSSVGISIVSGMDETVTAAEKVLGEFGDCMIEQYIAGRDVTVSILFGEPLPIIEIRPREVFYSYHSKYVDEKTEYLFDTITDASLEAKIQLSAVDCFNALGCRDFGRADFILGSDGQPYVLEVNTIPGFTTHSLLPMAARKRGLSMSELCTKIIEAALTSED